MLTGIKKLMRDFERRSFFSSVPLLLLLSITVITVLYYLSMMVSYLVQSRESDVALLRTRGVSTPQLLRLYALEGIVLTVVAIVLAPFIAMGTVAIAGKLPYFREITGGALLPVDLHWMPFAVAAGAGLLGLAIFVVPGVFGARAGLVLHKLRSSRPPSVPFFQRYYVDIGLLVVGGLIFWELRARGHIVSGGLFKDVEVNEALLLAPVLFLTVVALLFMRFFPLFVRFVSGESPALLNLVAAATVVSLAPATVVREVRDGDGLAWLLPVALLMALAWAYWATSRRPEGSPSAGRAGSPGRACRTVRRCGASRVRGGRLCPHDQSHVDGPGAGCVPAVQRCDCILPCMGLDEPLAHGSESSAVHMAGAAVGAGNRPGSDGNHGRRYPWIEASESGFSTRWRQT